MKIRAQIAMVLNLDKCIGCHTCSVTCKNVWTNREGMEYAWFNNVETKPGIGYPKEWENQEKWNGGWTRKRQIGAALLLGAGMALGGVEGKELVLTWLVTGASSLIGLALAADHGLAHLGEQLTRLAAASGVVGADRPHTSHT